MNAMMLYLIKAAACITLLYGVYWLFLRRDTFFSMNRIYLVGVTLFSMIFPLIPVRWTPSGRAAGMVYILDPVLITPDRIEAVVNKGMQWMEIAAIVYLTGVAIFFLRFIVQLVQLLIIVRRNGISQRNGTRVVYVDKGYSPFSFFNLVFINGNSLSDDKLEAILVHERVHVNQMHTLDLITAELFTCLQWFNPFAWLTAREIKTVHEYLADEGALKSGISRPTYQQMILEESMGFQVNGLTNNFNVSLIKKRILMISKNKSGKLAGSKFLLAVPVIFILAVMLSVSSFGKAGAPQDAKSQATAQAKPALPSDVPPPPPPPPPPGSPQDKSGETSSKKVYQKVEVMPEYPGGQDAMFKFILQNLKYPKDAIDKNVQGQVIISFVIHEDGSIGSAKVVKGIGSGCDEEALRVVKLMPKWSPGKEGGKAVAVGFMLPLSFKLDADKDKKAETPKK
jgi:TonB family protein